MGSSFHQLIALRSNPLSCPSCFRVHAFPRSTRASKTEPCYNLKLYPEKSSTGLLQVRIEKPLVFISFVFISLTTLFHSTRLHLYSLSDLMSPLDLPCLLCVSLFLHPRCPLSPSSVHLVSPRGLMFLYFAFPSTLLHDSNSLSRPACKTHFLYCKRLSLTGS